MKPAPFDYVAPATIDEAVRQLANGGDDASVLAGGQTLLPLLALRMARPSLLVDINRVGELAGVSRGEKSTRIGAAARQAALLTSPLVVAHVPTLARAVGFVGHHQTRNRGTIGGSVALGEPAAEIPAVALALGARIEVRSAKGTREIPADEFYMGSYMTALTPGELITAIHFPDWPGAVSVVHEVARRPGDFALVGLVCVLTLDGGVIARAGVAWFGMGPKPMRARQAEQAMIGRAPDALKLMEIGELAVSETAPLDDAHATSEYRRTIGARIFNSRVGQALNARSAA